MSTIETLEVGQTVATVERRLARLALDIHDGPMQNLTVVGLDLNALQTHVRPLLPSTELHKFDAGVEQVVEDLAGIERDLRMLLACLERDTAARLSLLDSIEAEIAQFERRSTTRVDLVVVGAPEPATDSQRIALHAILRTALANVAKHAEADSVEVRLSQRIGSITLEIEDDGKGFDPAEAYEPGHFGLRGIHERARLLGGHAEISSRPGGPTRVAVTLATWARVSADGDLSQVA
jgi:signal transduction histidine kinase